VRGRPLSVEDREEVFAGISRDLSDRQIASGLGRRQSVVSREITRNGGRAGCSPSAAQARCAAMVARPKRHKLEADPRLHEQVAAGLAADWSPQQVSARLRVEHPDDEAMRVSHETIVRHEAPGDRVEVEDLRRQVVAAA
jgi:IS30 family transposase